MIRSLNIFRRDYCITFLAQSRGAVKLVTMLIGETRLFGAGARATMVPLAYRTRPGGPLRRTPAGNEKFQRETLNYAGECGEVMAVWINLDLRTGRFECGAPLFERGEVKR